MLAILFSNMEERTLVRAALCREHLNPSLSRGENK